MVLSGGTSEGGRGGVEEGGRYFSLTPFLAFLGHFLRIVYVVLCVPQKRVVSGSVEELSIFTQCLIGNISSG